MSFEAVDFSNLLQGFADEVRRESWLELFGAVVVMYPVREPYALEVGRERFELVALAVAFIINVYRFEQPAYAQVVASVLVPKYVASGERCFAEEINEQALACCQRLETCHAVSQQLNVGKTFVGVAEGVWHSLSVAWFA